MSPELIEVKQHWPGFDPFIGVWLCRTDLTLVVDVGPSASIPYLIARLKERHIDHVDYVLLSHVHIDHAGGLAEFLAQYPMAKVICHTKGVKHLTAPQQLWQGSLQALGKIAERYGPIQPVSPDKIVVHSEARVKGLRILTTPGHAAHHLSFCYQGCLFAGEAAGNYFMVQGKEYLRPATPPVFFLKPYLDSIRELADLEDQPICYAHFGRADGSRLMLQRIHEQILRWKEIIAVEMKKCAEGLEMRCLGKLLEQDPELAAFSLFVAATQEREKIFMKNSIKGIADFLSTMAA